MRCAKSKIVRILLHENKNVHLKRDRPPAKNIYFENAVTGATPLLLYFQVIDGDHGVHRSPNKVRTEKETGAQRMRAAEIMLSLQKLWNSEKISF